MSPWLADLFLGSQTDERLVALARAGHERAFTTIVDRYRRDLIAYARRFDAERAEDLVQQTLLSAFSALQSGPEVRHLRGWLYQILRNLAARTATASAVETELTAEQAVTESAHDAAERRLLAFQALTEVARLPTHQHDALVATALQGRARAEVAKGMGLSEGAVRQLVHRARATVRTAVAAIIPAPVARWFSGARSGSGVRLAEATAGAGTATAGGFALKVGGLVASGVLATGVISALPRSAQHRGHGVGIVAANAGLITARTGAGPAAPGSGPAAGLARVPIAMGGAGGAHGVRLSSESRSGRSPVTGGDPGDRHGSGTTSGTGGGGSSGRDGGESSGGSGRSDGSGSGSDGGSTPATIATSSHEGSGGSGTGSSGGGGDSSGSGNSGPGGVDGGSGSGTSGSDGGGAIQATISSSESGSAHDAPATSDGSGTSGSGSSGSGGSPGPN